jgi:hypothetical protein
MHARILDKICYQDKKDAAFLLEPRPASGGLFPIIDRKAVKVPQTFFLLHYVKAGNSVARTCLE